MDEEFLIFIGFVLLAVVFVYIYKLSKRMTFLENYLQNATKYFGSMSQAPAVVTQEIHTSHENNEGPEIQQLLEQEALATPMPPQRIPVESAFWAWIKRDWLMKLGAFLIILGMAWFVNYAIAQGWIGPVGRISLGLMVGAGVLILGRYRMNSYISQGGILMFTGALGIILTVWAGRELYGFFDPISVLVIIFLTSAVLGITSVHFNRLPLAYANVLLGALAPLMTASHMQTLTGLYTYLLVLTLGAIWVAAITGWRQLVLLSLIIVSLYGASFLETVYFGEEENGLLFSFVFTALFFLVSIIGMRKGRETKIYDLLTAALSGLYLLVWILAGADEEWQVLLLSAWTLIFGFGAFTALRLGATINYFFTYTGVGVLLLGVATAIQLDGPPELTIAYIFEAALLLVIGYRLTRKASYIALLALPSIAPIFLSIGSMERFHWRNTIFSAETVTLYILIAVSVLLALYFESERQRASENDTTILKHARNVAFTIASIYSTIVVWLASYGLFGEDGGVMVALFVYTLVALFFYMEFRKTGAHWQRTIATIFFIMVVGRLLLVDVWQMELLFRVFTFIVIGILLVVVAWYARNREK